MSIPGRKGVLQRILEELGRQGQTYTPNAMSHPNPTIQLVSQHCNSPTPPIKWHFWVVVSKSISRPYSFFTHNQNMGKMS